MKGGGRLVERCAKEKEREKRKNKNEFKMFFLEFIVHRIFVKKFKNSIMCRVIN